jgi:acyl carrier protein
MKSHPVSRSGACDARGSPACQGLTFGRRRRFSASIVGQGAGEFVTADFGSTLLMDRQATDERIRELIEPFNKKGVEVTDATTFAEDLELDSLSVMDFVAAIEDEFDIIISMNQQAEIENYGQLVDAVVKLQA